MGMYNSITQEYGPEPCTNCGRVKVPEVHRLGYADQWWSLSNAHGLFGYFCPDCAELTRHDCYGKPRHLEEYQAILVKQQLISANGDI